MKNTLKRLFILLFASIISLSVLSVAVSAGEVVTQMVNVADSNKNMHGPGYEWNNVTKVLTLSDVNIDTEDDYGIRLPKNCTVVLEGENYIKASKYAIACLGTIVFKGSGSLTVESGEIGFYLTSLDSSQKVRLLEGDYRINAGRYGVYSENADFSFVGGTMDISVTADDGEAISGRVINILGGKFTSTAPISAFHIMTLDSADVKIDANRAAISAKTLYLENLSIDEYNGESSVDIKSTAPMFGDSIIFGEGVPSYVDYVLLIVFLGGIVAAIAVPAVRKKKKAEALYKRLEEEGYVTK